MVERTIEQMLEEYIHLICNIASMGDTGVLGLYGLEQHRAALYEKICEELKIDKIKSKDIMLYLDEKIGLDYASCPADEELEQYGKALLNLLQEEKGKGSL